MRKRLNTNKLSLTTVNPFKGKASLVLRSLLAHPEKSWTGTKIAINLGLSTAWVNRVIGTLEIEQIIKRSGLGPSDKIQLTKPKELIKKWKQHYHIQQNVFYHYLVQEKNPVKQLNNLSTKIGFDYAITGYAAANTINPIVHNAIPMAYLWPKSNQQNDFESCVFKIENIFNFIPVRKNANIIIIKPIQKNAALFDSYTKNKTHYVSPLQLYLDLLGLDRGEFVIKELETYWEKRNLSYAL
jgi:hypothetical protein